MTEQTPPFHISYKYEVVPLKKERGYLIPISDWEYLKKRVKLIKSVDSIFHTIGSILLGVAGSAFLAALTLPKAITHVGSSTILVCWAVFGVTLTSGLLSLHFASQQRKVVTCSKDGVLDEMDRLEHKYDK